VHLQLEDFEPLSLECFEAFFDAYLLLDHSRETFTALVHLLDEAFIGGESVRVLRNSKIRVVRTPVGSCAHPMRLYFLVEHRTVKYVHIEHYDENHP
jgi:hypothetical protein